jgi:hypothetical protein
VSAEAFGKFNIKKAYVPKVTLFLINRLSLNLKKPKKESEKD